MNVFVTGATGYVGKNLSLRLAREGYIVHALYRDIANTDGLGHENIKLFRGDILDKGSLLVGMKGCSQVFHTAALVSVWTRNNSSIESQIITGTVNVLEAALELSAEKVIYTSTAGVFGPSRNNSMINENHPYPSDYFIHYEKAKARTEQIVSGFVDKGLKVVIVNPTRIYGPGPLNDANSVSKIIKRHLEGKIGLVPSDGRSIGNYVYVDDVAEGHILAMKKGRSGERYILGGENIAFIDLMKLIARESGRETRRLRIPVAVMSFLSWIFLAAARLTGIKPLIVPGLVRRFRPDWIVSSEKAREELGYHPVGIEQGIKKTIEWLKEEYQL